MMRKLNSFWIGSSLILFILTFTFSTGSVNAVVDVASTTTLFGYSNEDGSSGGGGGEQVTPDKPLVPNQPDTIQPIIKPEKQQTLNKKLSMLPQTGFVNSSIMIIFGLILLLAALLTYYIAKSDENNYAEITNEHEVA